MTLPVSVAAGHPATAAAGAGVLSDGGTAADAVAAMILAGCVAETIFSGLGGGGFAVVFEAATARVHCLDFFVAVPGLDGSRPGAGRAIAVSFGGVAVPYEVGGATVAVPGNPSGVAELNRRFGRLPLSRLAAPAVALAESGAVFPAEHAALLSDIAPAMLLGDGVAAYSRPTGALLAAGDLLHHPGLAETLEQLGECGPAALLQGPWGRRLVDAVRADGGALSTEDLAAYRVRELPLGRVAFAGTTVQARGNDLDGMLDTLRRLDPATLTAGDAARAVALAEAFAAPPLRSETTSVAAVDADGNACAATHSLGLGSGVWVQGVHANSMLGEGELIRGELAPGQRMGSMMTPTIVTRPVGGGRPDELVAALGAAGGSRIRPALIQVLVRSLLDGAALSDAIAAPRLTASPGVAQLEPGFAPAVPMALREAGFAVRQWPERRPYFGGVAGIGAGGPAADPRRGGVTITL
ncbi:gamma-glutamyltransferase [Nakamurella aerolata]|uniref:Gamma-glutamyltranspeptidase n=1 Tax=Nakamurella aerolata TaxID=1656892 RepID=A0A849A556_9ACTN|nr:gamma-glutamyltranspeptidase [Nakamurella aerolata]